MRHNSDHHPILLNYSRLTVLSPKPFHFYSMWVSHSNFLPDVKLFWSSLNFTGNPRVLLQHKLKMLRAFLRNWNKNVFGHVDVNISLAKQALADIQGDISELGISEDLHSKEVDAH